MHNTQPFRIAHSARLLRCNAYTCSYCKSRATALLETSPSRVYVARASTQSNASHCARHRFVARVCLDPTHAISIEGHRPRNAILRSVLREAARRVLGIGRVLAPAAASSRIQLFSRKVGRVFVAVTSEAALHAPTGSNLPSLEDFLGRESVLPWLAQRDCFARRRLLPGADEDVT